MDLLAYTASALLGIAVMFGPAVITVAIRNRRRRSRFIPSPCPTCHHTGGWHDHACPVLPRREATTNVREIRA